MFRKIFLDGVVPNQKDPLAKVLVVAAVAWAAGALADMAYDRLLRRKGH